MFRVPLQSCDLSQEHGAPSYPPWPPARPLPGLPIPLLLEQRAFLCVSLQRVKSGNSSGLGGSSGAAAFVMNPNRN